MNAVDSDSRGAILVHVNRQCYVAVLIMHSHTQRKSQMHRALFQAAGITTALIGVASGSAPVASASDPALPARPAQIEVVRRAQLAEIAKGWWHALYTASFAEPDSAGHRVLGPLRLFSYDVVQPGGTFALHPHDNVEVITVVLEGSFEHEDTAGGRGRAGVGDVMLMSAGRGLQHAERGNATVLTRVVTIWLAPRTRDTEPRHAIGRPAAAQSGWQLIAAERAAPLIVDQDARVLLRRLAPGEQLSLEAPAGRALYLGTVEGEWVANDQRLAVPERLIARNGQLSIASSSGATVVLVDLPQS